MKIYLDNGYFNAELIMKHEAPFIICIGGRGTGKTYGILDQLRKVNLDDSKNIFMHLRRTQTQLDILNKQAFSAFTELNEVYNDTIRPFPFVKGCAAYYRSKYDEKEKLVSYGDLIGVTAALSTFSNLRSIPFHMIKTIFYDEFIPERHESRIKNEGSALLNLYETVNRNREIKGETPVKLIMASNANTIYSPILDAFGVTNQVYNMVAKHKQYKYISKKGILIIQLFDSEISSAKADTALYKVANDAEFESMALANKALDSSYDSIISRPLGEYKLHYAYGMMAVYEHKYNGRFYCIRQSIPGIRADDIGAAYIHKNYNRSYRAYIDGKMDFDSAETVSLFRALWGV